MSENKPSVERITDQFVSFTSGLEGSPAHLLSIIRGRDCSGGRANHSPRHGQSEMKEPNKVQRGETLIHLTGTFIVKVSL